MSGVPDTARQQAEQVLGRAEWRDMPGDIAHRLAEDLLVALDRVDALTAELKRTRHFEQAHYRTALEHGRRLDRTERRRNESMAWTPDECRAIAERLAESEARVDALTEAMESDRVDAYRRGFSDGEAAVGDEPAEKQKP